MEQRPSSYDLPHKALRSAFSHTIERAGHTSFNAGEDVRALYAQCRELFQLLHEHVNDENAVILAHLDERLPHSGDHDRHDHEELEEQQAQLEQHITALEKGTVDQAGLDKLYRGLILLQAAHLLHMDEEEQVTQLLLWKHFTEDELDAMRGEIMTALGFERTLAWFKWALPAIDRNTRVGVLSMIFEKMPPEFGEHVRELCVQVLQTEEWRKTSELLTE